MRESRALRGDYKVSVIEAEQYGKDFIDRCKRRMVDSLLNELTEEQLERMFKIVVMDPRELERGEPMCFDKIKELSLLRSKREIRITSELLIK